jgi:hypothetical protein
LNLADGGGAKPGKLASTKHCQYRESQKCSSKPHRKPNECLLLILAMAVIWILFGHDAPRARLKKNPVRAGSSGREEVTSNFN